MYNEQELVRVKATRAQVKLRLAVSSPTGFGKTKAALNLAKGMVGGDMTKVGFIDTENESASLYAPEFDGFEVVNLAPPYTAERYMAAWAMFLNDPHIEVVITDSGSHAWMAEGGFLDRQAALGGTWKEWAKVNPVYNKWLNMFLQSPKHMIMTLRKKQAHEQVEDETRPGKKKIVKLGLEDQSRAGLDYEMTLCLSIDEADHKALASKDRTEIFDGRPPFLVGPEHGAALVEWCQRGVQGKEIDIRPILDEGHPGWDDAKKYAASAYGAVAKIAGKYRMKAPVYEYLKGLEPAAPGAPTTQQMIDNQNKANVPTNPAPAANAGAASGPAASPAPAAPAPTVASAMPPVPQDDDRPF